MAETSELSPAYLKFLEPDCDRTRFISDYLEEHGVSSSVIHLNDKKHIYVNFPKHQYSGFFKIKTLVAHYDRVPESPGANDNSFAVFTMMNWAIELATKPTEHNIRLIFTDGEEIGSAGKPCKNSAGKPCKNSATEETTSSTTKSIIETQGAYDLAGVFKRLGIMNDEVYVFDCMGRGTIPVLGKPFPLKTAGSDFKKRYSALQLQAENILKTACPSSWVTLPVSLSDNAGFMATGIPAVVITMLPADEASKYMMDLVKFPPLEQFVTNKILPDNSSIKDFFLKLPRTWMILHSKYDNPSSITPESEIVFKKILSVIAEMKIQA